MSMSDEEKIQQLVRMVLDRDRDECSHDMLFVSEPVLLAAQQRLHDLGYRAVAEFGYTYSTLTLVQ